VDAQQTRRIIDRIVGYQLSPLLWRKIRKGLSAGRVQSVAVKIIAEREKLIAEFVPEEYWTITARLRENKKSPVFTAEVEKKNGKKLTLHNEAEADAVVSELNAAQFVVEKSERRETKKTASPPFTTSTLQQSAGTRLGFTTKKTMSLAQVLYERGLITYMRTDSVRLAGEAVSALREYAGQNFGADYVPAKPNFYSGRQNAQDAHEAIRPTDVNRTPSMLEQLADGNLTRDHIRLYDLIWRRALASQMTPAIYDVTTLEIKAGVYLLKASGSQLKFDGYLRLAPPKDLTEGRGKLTPYIEQGKTLTLSEAIRKGEQHFTKPPAHYTEASLVREMEKQGIGRPSTYAPTIQTIQDRGYVRREKKELLITELGVQVNDMLVQYFGEIVDIPFSADLETKLDEVAEHKRTMKETLNAFYKPFHELLEAADRQIVAAPPVVIESDVICEKCGRRMVIKEGRYGKFLACPGFPECRNTKSIPEKVGVTCPKCHEGEILVRKTRTGKKFYGCSRFPDCDFTVWDKPSATEKCPLCGGIMLEHITSTRKKILVCANPECENALKGRRPRVGAAEKNETSAVAKTRAKRKTKSAAAGAGENATVKTAAKKVAAKKSTAVKTATKKSAAGSTTKRAAGRKKLTKSDLKVTKVVRKRRTSKE